MNVLITKAINHPGSFVIFTWSMIISYSEWSFASKKNNFVPARFTEIVLPFETKKNFQVESDQSTNSITIAIEQSSMDKLEPLVNYDENIIKRLVIKDLGQNGVKATIFLKDQQLRSSVFQLDEPFRIMINIFDNHYQVRTDPVTNLPLTSYSTDLNLTKPSQNLGIWPPKINFDKTEIGPDINLKPNTVDTIHTSKNRSSKRKLLQPSPDLGDTPQKWMKRLSTVKRGRGPAWQEFPVYIYPASLSAYTGRKNAGGWTPSTFEPKMSKGLKIANFAYKMFSFSDELKALKAYQQVLYIEPKIFEKDPLHLWAFAECHLGQGNVTLADGYYKSLKARFPSTMFANLASLRRLDIRAIQALKKDDQNAFKQILTDSNKIPPMNGAESGAQLLIRQAFWKYPSFHQNKNEPPSLDTAKYQQLKQLSGNLESRKTTFLSHSLLFNSLIQKSKEWSPSITQFGSKYFERYRDQEQLPYYQHLKKIFKEELISNIVNWNKSERYNDIIINIESLPGDFKNISDGQPHLSWIIAESYRNIGQSVRATQYYEQVIKESPDIDIKMRAALWLSYLTYKETKTARSDRSVFRRKSQEADKLAYRLWGQLSIQNQKLIQNNYRDILQNSIKQQAALKTPALILLAAWSQSLSSEIEANSTSDNDPNKTSYSPSAATVAALDSLAKHFSRMGMAKERQQTQALLSKLKPKNIENNREAKKLWQENLLTYADELRVQNNLVEAGRMYAQAATSSEDWEKKAEVLYKGGLLLFRAGKREEAITAFEKASQDQNNLFYANLAKERLSQINR